MNAIKLYLYIFILY